ncbi:MAG: hypothetical protein JWM76_690 [Pseudonocardiales bacterium]|nr:hypothetical protein [Pseudonocardiales bacterium]
MVAVALGIVSFSPAASAKVVAGAITAVRVKPVDLPFGGTIRTEVDWCVPDGTVAGDTFSLVLAKQIGDIPPSFQLKDPANGAVVANAIVTGSAPATATFTLTNYAQTHQDVCGTAFFTGLLNSDSYAGTTQDFTYTSNDGKQFTTPVTIGPKPTIDRTHARKTGRFTRSDQCREVAASCISWVVETPIGPSASGTITDTIHAGQALECSSVKLLVGSANPTTGAFTGGVTYALAAPPVCSPAGITVNYGAVPAGQLLQLSFSVSLPTVDVDGGVSYVNSIARVIDRNATGVVRDDRVQSALKSATAGGLGNGVSPVPAVQILKGDVNGNAGDTVATAVNLGDAPGAVGIVLKITNSGTEPLLNVVVSDQVVANGTVTGLSCIFPDASTGTTWAGPFAAKASFECTAQLAGVAPGAAHEDNSTVVGVGQFSGVSVTATNGYFATATETTEVLGETGSIPTGGGTAEAQLANTGAAVGGLLWLFIGLAASGGLLIFAGRRRSFLRS